MKKDNICMAQTALGSSYFDFSFSQDGVLESGTQMSNICISAMGGNRLANIGKYF